VHLFLNNNKALDFLPINSIKNGGITEGVVISVKNELPIKLDMSLIPKHKSEDDFILWLADFIDRITIDTSKNLP
ncbi:hypothetical protein M0O54_13810, partial [Acinetobacter lactucae]